MTDIIVEPIAPASRPNTSYFELSPVIGGALVAAAISTIMTSFGSAIGLSLTSPLRGEGTSGTVAAIVLGLWVLWVAVSSFAAGGYFAGRMRRRLFDASEHESNVRDGAHGLAVWAIGVLLLAWVAASGVAGVARVAGDVAGSAASGAGAAIAQTVSPEQVTQLAADQLVRGNRTEGGVADFRVESGRILTASLIRGTLAPEDRSYLAEQVAARTGIAQPEAEQRVDAAFQQMQQAAEEARLVADKARKIAILIAFLTAASLMIAGAAAWFGAVLGGNHRDEETDLSYLIR